MALSGVAPANRYEGSRVDVSSRWGIRVRRRAEAREKPEERRGRGEERVEEGGRRKVGSLESWRVAGGCAGLGGGGGGWRRGCRSVERQGVGGGGRVDAKRVDSALDQGPLSLVRREKTRIRGGGASGEGDRGAGGGWPGWKGVRDEEGCGGHE